MNDALKAPRSPDGPRRCAWVDAPGVSPDYVEYHDREWGQRVHGDGALFERIVLEGFQSGLSWLTILRKRAAFRAAFADFDPAAVAAFDEHDVQRLLGDARIVRHRRKIGAAIVNARATVALRAEGGDGALDRLVWSFAPSLPPPAPVDAADVPARTETSTALASALKRAGFVFVGPTTAYATMQACGLVNDHLARCDYRERAEPGPGQSMPARLG